MPSTSPRTFTHHDLTEGITTGEYNAMSEADQHAFDLALVRLWTEASQAELDREFASDLREAGGYG